MSLVRFILLVAILVLALSFFGISIRSIVESPAGRDNFTFLWELIRTGWHVLMNWFSVLSTTFREVVPHTSA